MSKRIKNSLVHERVNEGFNHRPYLSKGRVWVKKALMFLNYEYHNDKNKPDKQEWLA
jgi:hypothetical protein